MNPLFDGVWGTRIRWGVFFVVIFLALFLLVQIVAGFQSLRYIGAGSPAGNTISVSGYGEAFAVPDIATFTFSVVTEKPTVAAAQTDVTTKANAITAYLKASGVDEKDIKTTDYGVNPQYDYIQQICPASTNGIAYPCRSGEQKLRGYEVRQTTTVKVRDTAKAGELLSGVGGKGATEVSGLQFTFDDPDTMQNEARNEAITNARAKAAELAKQLNVRLVRVVSFSENGSNPPMPYYAKDMALQSSAGGTANVAPELSPGQNKVTSNVSVTYEIR